MKQKNWIAFKGAMFAALMACSGTQAQTPAWPSKPIRLVIGSPAGSGTDAISRLVGNKVSEALGQVLSWKTKPVPAVKLPPR